MMPKKLKIEVPSQGWSQFLTARQEMLDAFDRAREKTRIRQVEAFHGKVAESEFRKWLSTFLPKRYGVTSGYIVSFGLKSIDKTPHYDVIIYDQLESPILWAEDYPDVSSRGQSLAIPVEYVKCVLEVKSQFSSKTVSDSLQHLKELLPLMADSDAPNERYKLYLNPSFCCGVIFFELKGNSQYSEKALSKIISGIELRGFFGGVILRGEGHSKPTTGKLSIIRSETPIESNIGINKASLLIHGGISQSIQSTQSTHFASMLTWFEFGFSQFAFDLVTMMQGKYELGKLSSFYGMGTSEWE